MDLDTVEDAYRRLKSYVYYDSSSLHLRHQICEFEKSERALNTRLKTISLALNATRLNREYFKDLLDDIDYSTAVKEFDLVKSVDAEIIHSQFKNKSYSSKREVYFADIPVQLQIICTMFVQLFGCKLESAMSAPPYGNKLDCFQHANGTSISPGLKLYEQYYFKYQDWRNNAVSTVKKIDALGKNSILVNLDLKDFYHTARVDFEKLEKFLFKPGAGVTPLGKRVFLIVKMIHKRYMECFEEQVSDKEYMLPIGLISSGVIANWYLDPLDKAITKRLSPDYYGRYVDDILIVLPLENGSTVDSKTALIDKLFCKHKLFEKDQIDYNVSVPGLNCLKVQQEKFQVIHFVSDELTSLLDKYVNDAKKRSSEYRLLPDEECMNADFNEYAFNLEYSGDGIGLNEIKGFSDSKYGISGFLGKKLALTMQGGEIDESETNQKLLRLFKGPMAIEMYRLWEKLFTYLLLSGETKLFHKLHQQISEAIDELVEQNEEVDADYFKEFYRCNLVMAIGMSYALKPSSLESKIEKKRLEKTLYVTDLIKLIKCIRASNMARHKYMQAPLLNYLINEEECVDLVHLDSYFNRFDIALNLSPHKKKYSPRFVNFDEVAGFHFLKRVKSISQFGELREMDGILEDDYLAGAYEDYRSINSASLKSDQDLGSEELFSSEMIKPEGKNFQVRDIKIHSSDNRDQLKVGLVSMTVPDEVLSHKYMRKPNVSPDRLARLRKVLDHAEEEKVDLLVFPEISIPVSSLFWLADYARKKHRAMVFGLEHWIVGNHALNIVVTLLPVKVNGYSSLIVNLRLKNHYSPDEKYVLEGYRYEIPKNEQTYYDLIDWNGVKFTVFNCFELCNVEHRSYFRSKVDILFASEFNKDVNYFSNIVESAARDLHCYVVQSNDAKFGDSRICQPANTIHKDLLKLKGGINPFVIVGNLDVGELREFQIKDYIGQKDHPFLKATPPEFDKNDVESRIRD